MVFIIFEGEILQSMETDTKIENELRVKELLKERGILMKDFAEQIGIKRESLTRALQNNPQYSTLKAIADGLGLSVPELFKQKPQPEIYGCIVINSEAHAIKSIEDIKKLIE